MKHLVWFVVLGLILLSVIGCGEGGGGEGGGGQGSPVLVPQSQNLVNGMITVSAGGYYDQPFSVTSSMQNARVTGYFEASGGSGNDIVVLVMDDMMFTNWLNNHQTPVCYNSGQITVANFDMLLCSGSGEYHLVFSNRFSVVSSKSVSTRVDLNWSELRYQ